MKVRLAESCREIPLKLAQVEWQISRTLNPPRVATNVDPAPCEQDIFLSFFFDGTNNNKYRDTRSSSQTNVARLFEACVGAPTPIATTYGGTPDVADLRGAPAGSGQYYRKTYIPGLGTAFSEIKDTGEGTDRTGGLAAALQGEARIVWALLQVTEHLHQALLGSAIPGASNDGVIARRSYESSEKMLLDLSDASVIGLPSLPSQKLEAFARIKARHERNNVLRERATLLEKSAGYRISGKPRITRLRLSVFGFSRGAAAARVFVNWLFEAYGNSIAGIPLQIDFLGIFDTVASVGLAHGVLVADGHMGWADGENLVVPEAVRRCVHLISAHEVRGSFPLDSVCNGGVLPDNCKEIVYPGVHSDVGGGYPPKDQGRAPRDEDKLSQISLAQMYREALIAGVPLRLPAALGDKVGPAFSVSPTLREAFNAYIQATRTGATPAAGMSDMMFPEETQPPGTIHQVLRDQYRHYLSWRKFRLGRVHLLANVQTAQTNSRAQDIEDLRTADEELRQELIVLNTPAWQRALRTTLAWGSPAAGIAQLAAQQEKLLEWPQIKPLWESANLDANRDHGVIALFDHYVHDSRAWFKISAMDDSDWFDSIGPDGKQRTGELSRKKQAKLSELRRERARLDQRLRSIESPLPTPFANSVPSWASVENPGSQELQEQYRRQEADDLRKAIKTCDAEISDYESDARTFYNSGFLNHEIYSVWGYLRWRRIYTSGAPRLPKPVYRPVDRGAAVKALDKRHGEYMAALLKGINEARANVQAQHGDMAAFEKSQQQLIEYTTRWMAKERASM